MSRQALQNFVDDLVVEMGKKSPVLRSDYNLQPHTFVFTPGRLATQMIMAAKNSAKDGWELTNKDMAEIRMLADKQGAFLVNYIKSCFGMIEEIFDKFKPSIVVSPVLNSFLKFDFGSPGRIRTNDPAVNSRLLCH